MCTRVYTFDAYYSCTIEASTTAVVYSCSSSVPPAVFKHPAILLKYCVFGNKLRDEKIIPKSAHGRKFPHPVIYNKSIGFYNPIDLFRVFLFYVNISICIYWEIDPAPGGPVPGDLA